MIKYKLNVVEYHEQESGDYNEKNVVIDIQGYNLPEFGSEVIMNDNFYAVEKIVHRLDPKTNIMETILTITRTIYYE